MSNYAVTSNWKRNPTVVLTEDGRELHASQILRELGSGIYATTDEEKLAALAGFQKQGFQILVLEGSEYVEWDGKGIPQKFVLDK